MSASETGGSVERVRAALLAAGHPDTITQFPAGTRTAADAAAAVGCTVAQIAKSIVFRCGMRAAVVITSGANRVDPGEGGGGAGGEAGTRGRRLGAAGDRVRDRRRRAGGSSARRRCC